MFFLLGSGSGSPIEARIAHRGDILIIIVLLIAIAAVLGIAFVVWMRIKNYYKSEAYIEKERSRKTKLKDVQKLAKENKAVTLDDFFENLLLWLKSLQAAFWIGLYLFLWSIF